MTVIMMSSAQRSTVRAAHPTRLHLELLVTVRKLSIEKLFVGCRNGAESKETRYSTVTVGFYWILQ